MKNSKEWWEEIKSSEDKLINWLKNQYHGEKLASVRIMYVANKFLEKESDTFRILNLIAAQEEEHASWIAKLCSNRNIHAIILNKEERYWSKTLPDINMIQTIEQACGIAAHAEQMRLERIRVIANDSEAPEDIREVFKKILPQEEFHSTMFKTLATEVWMKETLNNHKAGLNALGLIA